MKLTLTFDEWTYGWKVKIRGKWYGAYWQNTGESMENLAKHCIKQYKALMKDIA
jgi:hypothetical protein